MVGQGKYGIDLSSRRFVYQGSRHHRASAGLKTGFGSGMRMLTFFINRAGKNLSAARRCKLQKAKLILSARLKAERAKQRRDAQ